MRSISAGVERVLSAGETVVTPPGDLHTVGPAGETDIEMIVEFRPALGFEEFVERTFALDRAGHLNVKGQGNPLRVATARPHDAEFFLARAPSACRERYFARWMGLADGSTVAAEDGVSRRRARRAPDTEARRTLRRTAFATLPSTVARGRRADASGRSRGARP